jgi:hypothetical protein
MMAHILVMECRFVTHRDILQCRLSLSANGGTAEVEGWAGPAVPVAFDPEPSWAKSVARGAAFCYCGFLG